jgi:hypothetical protein
MAVHREAGDAHALQPLQRPAGAEDGRVLGRLSDDVVAARTGGQHRAPDGQVVRLGAAAGNTTSSGAQPSRPAISTRAAATAWRGIYVASFTRYHTGQWETTIQQGARQAGMKVEILRTGTGPEDPIWPLTNLIAGGCWPTTPRPWPAAHQTEANDRDVLIDHDSSPGTAATPLTWINTSGSTN